ncbi:MAG: hypothetical protein IPN47_10550 [Gemmatimonadetes bacterium]|nr:hypothetical protein [Gemmatimonadota bacterium]
MTAPSPLDAGTVSHNVAHGIATVTFAHPKGNSLPGATLRELAATFDALAPRADVRVIVLRSEGHGPFCAGASFDALQHRRYAPGRPSFRLCARDPRDASLPAVRDRARIHGKGRRRRRGAGGGRPLGIAVRSASVRLSELAVGIGPLSSGR